jgi:cytochrome P450
VLRRLVEARLDPDVARVVLFGMVTGFVPTNTMTGGHMLDMLLAHTDFMGPTLAAVRANDNGRLERCLFEAMRFAPLLREPLRHVAKEYTVAEGSGFWHEHRFEPGDRVLAMTASAMMDERRVEEPKRYNPDRPQHELMLFGAGLHRCIGAPLATTQLVHTFKPLLQKNNLRRADGDAGELKTIGPFPEHLFVRFDA